MQSLRQFLHFLNHFKFMNIFPLIQDKPRAYWVYLFLTEETATPQKCKIGITSQLANRLSKVEHASGHKLHVHHLIPCKSEGQARAVEVALHNYFRQQRLKGEWFFLGKTDIELISKVRSAPHLLELYNDGEFNRFNEAA